MLIDWFKLALIGAILIVGGWIAVDWWQMRDAASKPTPAPSAAPPEKATPEAKPAPAAPPPAAVAAPPKPAPGSIQKYRDAQGVIHYTNIPDSIPDALRDKAVEVTLPVATNLDAAIIGKRLAAMASGSKSPASVMGGDPSTVHLFMTHWCPHCKKVRELLESLGVKYVKHDIEEDPASLVEWQKLAKGQAQVPLLVIRGTPLIGYRPEAIKEALNPSLAPSAATPVGKEPKP